MVSCPGDNQISLTGRCQTALGRSALELVHVVLALVLRTTERCTGTGQKVRLYTPLRRGSWQMSRQLAADMRNSI